MRRYMIKIFVPICSLLLVAWISALAMAGQSGLATVRFAISGRTAVDWPLFIAQEKKIFQKNGIFLEAIVIRGSTNTTRAVLSETVPRGRINPDYVITAIEKGAKAKIIAGTMEKIPYDLVARPEIKSGAELDYRFLIEELQAFPKDGSVSKAAMEKTMQLRANEGMYKGSKVPSSMEYVDSSFVEEAQRQLGLK